MKPKSEFKNGWCLQFKQSLTVPAAALLLCLAAGSSQAQTYKVLHSFNSSSDGAGLVDGLVLSGTTLYGTTSAGIFKLGTDGGSFAIIDNFYACGLTLSGTTLYGATPHDGDAKAGAVFKMNADGTGYTILHTFNGSDGRWPVTAGFALSGATLYGTTESGGAADDGTVFKVNTDGSGFAVLKEFSGRVNAGDGWYPDAGVLLSGTTLYGTTRFGGSGNRGIVFKVNTDGSGYTVLHEFSYGANPTTASLVLSGSTLYGTTASTAMSSGDGTIFKLNTDGSGFTVLKTFQHTDGSQPTAGLVLSGSTLFGTTVYGGRDGWGTVFALQTDGSHFTLLKEFASHGSDGERPCTKLVLSGTTLYGTTYAGGDYDYGVVFSLPLPLPTVIAAPPPSQTAELQSDVRLSGRAGGHMPMSYQWYFNEVNFLGCTTNCALVLTNIQYSQVGTYMLIVSNPYGMATSLPARLNVIPPVNRRSVPALNLMGETGSVLNVEYADALASPTNWLPLNTVNLTAAPQLYLDVSAPLPPQRFYRVWQTGTPAVLPSLNLPFLVPAITLTGNIGNSLRLDYINQFGPTNAWVTLDTVTLTNTSQLYFDVAAPGQPQRLYRIIPNP